jgi:hypothetical protein
VIDLKTVAELTGWDTRVPTWPSDESTIGYTEAAKLGVLYPSGGDDAATIAAMWATDPGAVRRMSGAFTVGTQLTVTDSLVVQCDPGTTFTRTHAGNVIRVAPPGTLLGSASATRADSDTTVTVTGATWTVNEHAGKWAEFATNAGSSARRRRIVSNTADTLTLQYAFGNEVASGTTITAYTPIDRVEINDLSIVGGGGGSALVVINYVSHVVLRRVSVAGSAGNGVTVNWADRVEIEDLYTDDTQFGGFVYMSDSVTITRPKVNNWTSTYGFQLKDCINGIIAHGIGDGGLVGKTAFNIKGSGLNPSRNLAIVDCWAINCTQSGLKMHALNNEGSLFAGENFRIDGGGGYRCQSAWQVQQSDEDDIEIPDADAGVMRNAVVSGVSALECTTGWSVLSSDAEVLNPVTERCALRAGTIAGNANGVIVRGGRCKNNSYNAASNSTEIRVDGVTDVQVLDMTYVHDDAASKSVRAVQELNQGEDRNVYSGFVVDTVGTWGDPYLLFGAASKVLNDSGQVLAATTLGSVTRKMEVFDAEGVSLGWVPIYDAIT